MPLQVSSTCAHRQEVKIVLYSLWYHHTYKFISCLYMFRAHVLIVRRSKLHYTASGIITPIGNMIRCVIQSLIIQSTQTEHIKLKSSYFIFYYMLCSDVLTIIWYNRYRRKSVALFRLEEKAQIPQK